MAPTGVATLTLPVSGALDGERVDRILAALLDRSRAEARALVERGAVRVDGAVVDRAATRLHLGQVIEVAESSLVRPSRVVEPDSSVDVVVVDETPGYLVVDKPPGLVVHPGAGNATGTLVHGLLALDPGIAEVGEDGRPGLVHRLDAGTSGLLVVARTPEAHATLVDALAAREVTRRYVALAGGSVEHDRGSIDAPIGRSRRDPTRMVVREDGREARTRYEVRRRFEGATLLDCELETGRTHQIRVHLRAIGHPIVGDHRYGGMRVEGLARPFLHAAALSFRDPLGGEQRHYESPLPEDLGACLSWFERAAT